MAIIDNVTVNEILEILTNGPKPVHFAFEATLHVEDIVIRPYKVLSIEINRNYVKNMADETTIELLVPGGSFDGYIFPNRDRLEVSLKSYPIQEVGSDPIAGANIEIQRYRGVLYDRGSKAVETKSLTDTNIEKADLNDLRVVRIQLIDSTIEILKMMSAGGIFRQCTTADAIRFIMGSNTKRINVDESIRVRGVDVAPDYIPTIREHVIVPHLTKLTSVGRYIHENCGGVYNSGFGNYLQQGIWYVYPVYNLNRIDSTVKGITFLNLPSNMMPGVERTFRVMDNHLYVLLTGDVKHKDLSEELQLNLGNGVRYYNADRILNGFAEVEENKAIARRAVNAVEFLTNHRATNLNNVLQSDRKITANHGFEMSQLAAREGAQVQAIWENSRPSLIRPGLPCRYITLKAGKVEVYRGQVQHTQHYLQSKSRTITQNSHICNSAVTLFISVDPDEE